MPKAELAEPTVSLEGFEQRCKTLAVRFGDLLAVRRGEVAFAPETSSTQALMTLAGRASEIVERNMGRQHRVIALCPLTNDVYAWVGYRERWQKELNEKKFRFVDGGFTLHIGMQGEMRKPQILRSEWVGPRSIAFVDQAGHPHWQFDALESLRTGEEEIPARFGETAEPVVREFGQEQVPAKSDNLVLRLTVEKMHPGERCSLVASAGGAGCSLAQNPLLSWTAGYWAVPLTFNKRLGGALLLN